MTKKMLIDAAHPEQTRVAVVDGNRVEEFDFESQSKKQLRGNIYLAKITRVEASLQAAFVDYGGNRHGFLAFNEIHPDYYQIPVKDREELIKLEEEEEAAEVAAQVAEVDVAESEGDDDNQDHDDDDDLNEDTDAAEEAAIATEAANRRRKRRVRELRRYKIQEVVKPGQVILVQVSKEERGNKGAALSSYLSLAGRYCVLMPNTARGGGVSRKISNITDRKRLKSVISGLDLPKGVGLIIRTAGSKRTKVEIKRDYEYLGRLWSTIRENTLSSMAPDLVHEEGGLVRRAVRDLYDKDIEAIYVEGSDAYHEAHDFMKMLMPSHAARVKHYNDTFPIFLKHQVEEQLEAIYDPNVRLKSGGYLVIHQTEALVAVDVNSGRSTKERNIEATALKTNLEAADEACRQMRLRDLAGLLVIDFIDMDENKNVRAVEKRMKDALKRDRARVQMGRISSFGLMELSRQRRRASVIEGSSQVCPTCDGIGVVRSVESAALSALQALEGEAMKGQTATARLTTPTEVALYLLNEKRVFLDTMERNLDMRFIIAANPDMHPPQFEIEAIERRTGKAKPARPPRAESDSSGSSKPQETKGNRSRRKPAKADNVTETNEQEIADNTEEAPKKRRRGRRGGRGRRRGNANTETMQTQAGTVETAIDGEATPVETKPAEVAETTNAAKKPRRRRRAQTTESSVEPAANAAPKVEDATPETGDKPKRPARRRRPTKTAEASAEPAAKSAPKAEDATPETGDKPKRPVRRRRPAKKAEANAEPIVSEAPKAKKATPSAEDKPKRPVRRRRPAKKAEASAEPIVSEAPKAKKAEPEAEDKPKRPVRRRKAAAKPSKAAAQDDVPAPKPDAPKKSAEATAPKRRKVRSRKPASDTAAPESKNDSEKPEPGVTGKVDKDKKGWWSRRFNS